jgi:hypothetical protein
VIKAVIRSENCQVDEYCSTKLYNYENENFVLFICSVASADVVYSPSKHESLTTITCPAPLGIALFKNGAGRPVALGVHWTPALTI